MNLNIEDLSEMHIVFFKILFCIINQIQMAPDTTNTEDNSSNTNLMNNVKNSESYDFILPSKFGLQENFYKYCRLHEKHYISSSKPLVLILRSHFHIKLITWRYLYFKALKSRKHVCRLCEESFTLNDFFLHAKYCMQKKVYIKSMFDIKNKIIKALENLEKFKEEYKSQSHFTLKSGKFKPKTSFLPPSIRSKTAKSTDCLFNVFEFGHGNISSLNPCNKFTDPPLDYLRIILAKEKGKNLENYEKMPYRLVSLNKTIHFIFSTYH